MFDESSPWILPLVLLLVIGSVSVGSIVLADSTDDSNPYPDRPDSLTQANVVDFVTEYESAYAHEEISSKYSSIQQISYDAENRTILEQTKDGYVVHLKVTLRWNGKQVEGDRHYVVNYFVNSSVVARTEADSVVYPGPDPRINGTTLSE